MAAVGVDVPTVGVECRYSDSLTLLLSLVASISRNGRCRSRHSHCRSRVPPLQQFDNSAATFGKNQQEGPLLEQTLRLSE